MKSVCYPFALLVMLSILTSTGCVEDPEPGPGFNESFYVMFDFNGTSHTFEEDDPELQYGLQPGVGNTFTNIFSTGSSFELYITLHMDFDPDKNDLQNLEGTNIPIEGDNGVPWVRFFLEGGTSYSTGVDPIDYGASSFLVEEVIKGPVIDYDDPLTGDDKKGRSYILRGTFDFDISLASWSQGVPVDFFPITNGQFSIRVFAP